MTETWMLATIWLGLALAATLISIWLRIATALSEIVIGTVAQLFIGATIGATVLGVHEPWVTFLAGAGAIILTFLAGTVGKDHVLIRRLRTVTFGLLTPFYFIRAGSFVSVPVLIAGPTILITLLMSTGLTFGSISALFGLSHNIIDTAQYSFLIATVVGSAVIPTLIANAFFLPRPFAERKSAGKPGGRSTGGA